MKFNSIFFTTSAEYLKDSERNKRFKLRYFIFYFFTITTHSLLHPIGQPIFNGLGLNPSSLAALAPV